MNFSIVVAMDQNRGIGQNGRLPWQLSADLKYFKELTSKTLSSSRKNAVVMGRKTWDSIPEKFRPLPGRKNVVLTRDESLIFPPGVDREGDLKDFFVRSDKILPPKEIENIFVIGGQQIFEAAIGFPQCRKLYITHILKVFPCDAFFPDFEKHFSSVWKSAPLQENGINFHFSEYERRF